MIPSGIVPKDPPAEQTRKDRASSIASGIAYDQVLAMMDIVSIDNSIENGTTTVSVDTPSSPISRLELHRFCVTLSGCLPFTV